MKMRYSFGTHGFLPRPGVTSEGGLTKKKKIKKKAQRIARRLNRKKK